MRCLRKDPARRFQSMADLKVALEELKEEFDSGALASMPNAGGKRPEATARGVPSGALHDGGPLKVSGAALGVFALLAMAWSGEELRRPGAGLGRARPALTIKPADRHGRSLVVG